MAKISVTHETNKAWSILAAAGKRCAVLNAESKMLSPQFPMDYNIPDPGQGSAILVCWCMRPLDLTSLPQAYPKLLPSPLFACSQLIRKSVG